MKNKHIPQLLPSRYRSAGSFSNAIRLGPVQKVDRRGRFLAQFRRNAGHTGETTAQHRPCRPKDGEIRHFRANKTNRPNQIRPQKLTGATGFLAKHRSRRRNAGKPAKHRQNLPPHRKKATKKSIGPVKIIHLTLTLLKMRQGRKSGDPMRGNQHFAKRACSTASGARPFILPVGVHILKYFPTGWSIRGAAKLTKYEGAVPKSRFRIRDNTPRARSGMGGIKSGPRILV